MKNSINQLAIYSSVLFLVMPTSISANERLPCADVISPESQLAFENKEHRLWYRTFWDGKCQGLSFFKCFSGNSWNKAIVDIESSYKGNNHQFLRSKLCKLGHAVGYEWSRDNSVRCISTKDLKDYRKTLKSESGIFDRLSLVESQVNKKLENCNK
jgi:hypothetical protein